MFEFWLSFCFYMSIYDDNTFSKIFSKKVWLEEQK